MLKKTTTALLGLFLLASPLDASADQLSDLQAQIQTLLARVAALKAQSSQSTLSAQTKAADTACAKLSKNLSRGMRGDEVKQLQLFLNGQGYLASDSATGLFGPATERAVQKWQAQNAVASSGMAGYGTVGPRTRAALATKCGGSLSLRGSVDGRVQIQVKKMGENFLWTNGAKLPLSYTVSGSGSPSQFGLCAIWTDEFGRSLLVENGEGCDTLPKWGTSSEELDVNRVFDFGESDLTSVGKELLRNIGTGIRVGFKFRIIDATNVKTIESLLAAPSIAEDDTSVFNVKIAKETMDAAGRNERRVSDVKQLQLALELYFDAHGRYPPGFDRGAPSALSVLVTERYIDRLPTDPYSKSMYRYASRANGRGYVIGTTMEIAPDGQKFGDSRLPFKYLDGEIPADGGMFNCAISKGVYCAGELIEEPVAANKPPVISSFTGLTSATVGQPITWTVNAYDPEGGALSYQIYWGDELVPVNPSSNQGMTPSPNTTFSHTYAYPKAGTYTLSAYVHDSAGNQAGTERMVTIVNIGTLPIANVDLKVNGSDGPLTLSNNEAIAVSWTSNNVGTCSISSNVRPSLDIESYGLSNVSPSGSQRVYYVTGGNEIFISCQRGNEYVYDRVYVHSPGSY
ncbi:hypothetical protein A3D71_00140 [Candidatus Kaiserbacteria bacterium RIFCSPHIGHO2_02_FULL_55_20]|uniref:Peptidoglycan binding-like domain-containing protein n=1 Tax=Candidatus Kaiserbacteria bacterium RIFCSPHIGHO2_02_FULL_55_20 TaxID=1798497 RepID=A0A1F6DV76_9BACT|nr:MAG: hypothetical protein A2680_01705 [Candidatus Kaiserbacteria bacterium RIFCSPHIGHO2_01_FULL_55_37]OGG65349.1 MAG: hypothetical protein A3D71_00140 [Candidatus Kaiserbacteria bacterium RIFCSPHIGHO2_02_FULL_55_20]